MCKTTQQGEQAFKIWSVIEDMLKFNKPLNGAGYSKSYPKVDAIEVRNNVSEWVDRLKSAYCAVFGESQWPDKLAFDSTGVTQCDNCNNEWQHNVNNVKVLCDACFKADQARIIPEGDTYTVPLFENGDRAVITSASIYDRSVRFPDENTLLLDKNVFHPNRFDLDHLS